MHFCSFPHAGRSLLWSHYSHQSVKSQNSAANSKFQFGFSWILLALSNGSWFRQYLIQQVERYFEELHKIEGLYIQEGGVRKSLAKKTRNPWRKVKNSGIRVFSTGWARVFPIGWACGQATSGSSILLPRWEMQGASLPVWDNPKGEALPTGLPESNFSWSVLCNFYKREWENDEQFI